LLTNCAQVDCWRGPAYPFEPIEQDIRRILWRFVYALVLLTLVLMLRGSAGP
jgi:hypothetical protein